LEYSYLRLGRGARPAGQSEDETEEGAGGGEAGWRRGKARAAAAGGRWEERAPRRPSRRGVTSFAGERAVGVLGGFCLRMNPS
jgi:hypothetical protein